MRLKGKVLKYGANIDTDVIIAARHLTTTDPLLLGQHAMEDIDPEFAKKAVAGDIMLAGENFGCGSSREHAPLALLGAGISCVIAPSFARIFYRNAINVGLPIFECGDIVAESENGHLISVDVDTGQITNETTDKIYQAPPYPDFLKNIVAAGGLVKSLRKRFSEVSE